MGLREMAKAMVSELEGSRLTVELAPAREPKHGGHMVRVVSERNPSWYRRLCRAYVSGRRRARRKHDTLIKRRHTLRALEDIAKGRTRGSYIERLLPVVHREMQLDAARQLYEARA
jgi:hypothetical protein